MSCRLATWLQCVILSDLCTQPCYFVSDPKRTWRFQAVSQGRCFRGSAPLSSADLALTPLSIRTSAGGGSPLGQSPASATSCPSRYPVKPWELRPPFLPLWFKRLASKGDTHLHDLMSQPWGLPFLTHQSGWFLVTG